MSIRYEYKYLLSFREYILVKEYVSFVLECDSNGAKYPISSIYFDTNDFLMYKQKRDGFHEHNKIRLRQYTDRFDEKKPMYLESKQKRELTQLKKRKKLSSLNEFRDLMEETSFTSDSTEDYFFNLNLSSPLKPVVNVIYDREAFEGQVENSRLRITFDSHLRSQSFSSNYFLLSEANILIDDDLNNYIVMEVKFDKRQLPEVVRAMIKRFKLQSESFSKYAYCFEQNLMHDFTV